MKFFINTLKWLFNFLMGLVFILLVSGVTTFMILYHTGYIEEYYPSIYCWFNHPKDHYINLSETTIGYIKYRSNCECDTVKYDKTPQKNDTTTIPR